MDVPSYLNKTFVNIDNEAFVRNDNLTVATWKAGEALPEGAQVGSKKKIPKRAVVRATAHKVDGAGNVYVFAEPADGDARVPSGWTAVTNLEGQLANELLGYRPLDWDLVPGNDNYTVTDADARIRSGPPGFTSTGQTIPRGTFVAVTKRSATEPVGKFVLVREATVEGGALKPSDEIGWTAASNLTDGCSSAFSKADWLDEKGPSAAWQKGRFLRALVLVDLVGVGGEVEQVALHTLPAYLRLVAEAKKKNLELALESGFRTFAHQARLFRQFQQGTGNLAAEPGKSNHQHGQAFDLNTRGFAGDPRYDWLAKFGPKLGFIRTVKNEHWHWEYRPEEAAALAAEGRHKTGTWL